jgi:hypothetical protein
MPSKNESLKMIIDQIRPDILGLFWITDRELSRELVGFDEFNYLFDGLISQYLYGQKESSTHFDLEKPNFFFNYNFNQKIFLAHIKMNSRIAGTLDEHIAIVMENKRTDSKKILLFNTTSKDVGSDLINRYPQFEFINLAFS